MGQQWAVLLNTAEEADHLSEENPGRSSRPARRACRWHRGRWCCSKRTDTANEARRFGNPVRTTSTRSGKRHEPSPAGAATRSARLGGATGGRRRKLRAAASNFDARSPHQERHRRIVPVRRGDRRDRRESRSPPAPATTARRWHRDGRDRRLPARGFTSGIPLASTRRDGTTARVIVTPDSLLSSRALRIWGWAIQLYSARSRRSWGIGDLADLRRLGGWAGRAGAGIALISPLAAPSPIIPQQPSPLLPVQPPLPQPPLSEGRRSRRRVDAR